MAHYRRLMPIPTDDSSFGSFNCPFCRERFKLAAIEVQDSLVVVIHCPICGMNHERGRFMSLDAMDAARIVGRNLAREMVSDLVKDFGKSFRNTKNVRFTRPRRRPLKMEPERTLVESIDLEHLDLSCCDRSVKVRVLDQAAGIYCPYCGVYQ